ncbi:MAG TPA: matrixin family metalloprotease [Dehalococcoidia bacterium]|nr:matrixin family metalloprotease [Dehalococcoidia bacterium]
MIGAVWADDSIPVRYCVNPANGPLNSAGAPLMSDAAFAAAVRRAFQTWQDISGSYIAFAYTGLCSADPFDFRDQVNTIGWGWLFSSAIGLTGPSISHGRFQRQSSQGQYFEGDIVIDVRYALSFDDEAEYINRALPAILLHEVGHFIGLDHSNDPCSIMVAVITDNPPVLCAVDMNGARALYPQ